MSGTKFIPSVQMFLFGSFFAFLETLQLELIFIKLEFGAKIKSEVHLIESGTAP